MNKHLIWAITIFSIVVMLCGTLLWINHNSWTLRFEMDNNTKEAIESIEYPIINEQTKLICYDRQHTIYYIWNIKENILSNKTHDVGFYWREVDCPDDISGRLTE